MASKKKQSSLTNPVSLICCGCLALVIILLLALPAGLMGFISGEKQTFSGTGGGSGSNFEEDCFVKAVQSVNSSVSREKALEYKGYIEEASSKFDVNPALVAGFLEKESTWTNHESSGDKYSRGIAQITTYQPPYTIDDGYNPKTWESTIVPGIKKEASIELADIMDERQSILGGAWYFHYLKKTYNFTDEQALAAYNGGPGGYNHWTPEAYAASVVGKSKKYAKCLQAGVNQVAVNGCVKYLNQCELKDTGGEDMCSWGCGPTSIAMIAQSYGFNLTPIQIARAGTNPIGSGMYYPSTAVNVMNKLTGKKWKQAGSWVEIVNQVKSGNPVTVSTYFSQASGHYMTITGFKENGDVIVNDPYGNHGDIYTGGYNGNYNGEGAVYDLADFRAHFDPDGDASWSIYLTNPPFKLDCNKK